MTTLILIGFVGGLITGISPCILPVLPVIFFSGTQSVRDAAGDGAVATEVRPTRSQTLRPYLVIAGLVLSFSVATLLGSALLSLLHLPQDTVRWVALVALVAIGLGLIFPRFDALLEKPFSKLPQKQFGSGRNGFGLGLALGVLYVPCAGPVLAAIVVAGATGTIGLTTVALTLSFAVGAALPLLFFAIAGRRVAERVAAFRSRQRQIRIAAGLVTILLAVALVFNLPAVLQRAIPDYTSALQERAGGEEQIQNLNLGGLANEQNAGLSDCPEGVSDLVDCGTAPDIKGITKWLNTPGGSPIDLKSLRGKVVLIDFWAYSCINCQRAIPHVTGWYDAYKDKGFEVIGVHSPEYGFEKVDTNVASGAADLNIHYPIAMDNNLSTWTNYRNRYWPAEYLVDANGNIRHVKFGEGDYDVTESLIRQLLSEAKKGVDLPPATGEADTTPTSALTPETYLSVGNTSNYGGAGVYDQGEATFELPDRLADDSFALKGRWALDYQGATAAADGATIALNYHARDVFLLVGGTGNLTVTRDGKSTVIPVSGPPNTRQIVADEATGVGHLDVGLGKGLQAFSFTYG
jgi:cytochrome c biogenesis protein CcdA/thiol-disulfide isomerase/thioredoxin